MIKDAKEVNKSNENTDEVSCEEPKCEETPKKQTKKRESKAAKELAELKELYESKQNELSELNDKYLRVLAEYENYKKRTAKEKDAIYIDSVGETVSVLLPVLDNFERAISAFSEEDKKSDFYKGVEMIFNQTKDCFTKLGVSEIKALGEEFDPEFHNAIMHIDDEQIADNTIVEEFQKGYIYKDKVIRYSMVKVAN